MVQNHASDHAKNHFEAQETLRLEKSNSRHGWSVFLGAPGTRKRLLLIVLVSFFSQCSGNGLVSYYPHSILLSVGITGSYNLTANAVHDCCSRHADYFRYIDFLLGEVCIDGEHSSRICCHRNDFSLLSCGGFA